MKQKRKYNEEICKKTELRRINKMRLMLGMDPIVSKEKQCLRCKKTFMAEDAKNEYYCEPCKTYMKHEQKENCCEMNGIVI